MRSKTISNEMHFATKVTELKLWYNGVLQQQQKGLQVYIYRKYSQGSSPIPDKP